MQFTFQRHTGYYHLHIYWPSAFLVLLSWLQFWINQAETPQARMGFGAACLAAFILQVCQSVSY